MQTSKLFLVILVMAILAISGCAFFKGLQDVAGGVVVDNTPPPGNEADPNQAVVEEALTSAVSPYVGPFASLIAAIIIAVLYQLKVLKYKKVAGLQIDAIERLKTDNLMQQNINNAIKQAIGDAFRGNAAALDVQEKLYKEFQASKKG